jgi:hypothetical protein
MIKVQIHGRPWKIYTMTADQFTEGFKEELAGATLCDSKQIIFNEEDLNLSTIIHELTHASIYSLCLTSVDLTSKQLEEIYCEHAGEYGPLILKQAKWLEKELNR